MKSIADTMRGFTSVFSSRNSSNASHPVTGLPKQDSTEPSHVVIMDQDTCIRGIPGIQLPTYQKIDFDREDQLPTAAPIATPREKHLVDTVVKMVRKHEQGLYDSFYDYYHKLGWVSEQMAFYDPKVRVYLGKPGNLYEEMVDFAKSLTPNEHRFVWELLSHPNRKRSKADDFVTDEAAVRDGFDLQRTHEVIAPVSAYYLEKKFTPKDHMIEGFKYNRAFMVTRGLQPLNRSLPVQVTRRLPAHSSLAILKDALQAAIDPARRNAEQEHFEVEKAAGRRNDWQQKTTADPTSRTTPTRLECTHDGLPQFTIPRYVPKVTERAFDNLELPPSTRIEASLIDLPNKNGPLPLQVHADIAIHPTGNRFLMRYNDYSELCMPVKYAVSKHEPMFGDKPHNLIGIFDDRAEALKSWDKGPKQSDDVAAATSTPVTCN